jgi:hypothetical protein
LETVQGDAGQELEASAKQRQKDEGERLFQVFNSSSSVAGVFVSGVHAIVIQPTLGKLPSIITNLKWNFLRYLAVC